MASLRTLWDVELSRRYWAFRFRARARRARLPSMQVGPDDADYLARARAEEAFWESPPLNSHLLEAGHTGAFERFINTAYTGRADLSWMGDLLSRGPFQHAAVLGSTQGYRESEWLRAGGSTALDVYDISAKVLARAHRAVGAAAAGATVRFWCADLNFAELPRARYDVVWTTASLHHVTNLEYLLDEVHQALRPGGLLAIHDYVGEARFRYEAERMRLANDILRRTPADARRVERIEHPALDEMSPFEAIRSDETLALARERFDTLHLGEADALYPLGMLVDFAKLEREQPAVLGELFAAEEQARRSHRRCSVYGVFRKRGT